MEQFKTIEAAFNWLADQIRRSGIYQEPINVKNRMDNWSVDSWVWGVFKYQMMDAGYYLRITHIVDGWEAVERASGNSYKVTLEDISEDKFKAMVAILKDAVENAG